MNKGELKARLIFFLDPELEVRDSHWTRAFAFYQGYSKCFDDVIKFPVEDSYAQSFIIDETLSFLNKIIINE